MLIHELTPAECREVLGRATYGRLGCARGDQPYVVPFVFQLDPSGECLYSFSTLGQKIDWMRGNPKVCVEVDEVVDQRNWTSVLALGRYEEIRGAGRQDEDLRRQANELFQHRSNWWLPALAKLASGEEHHSPVVFRILIDKLTGRRAARAR